MYIKETGESTLVMDSPVPFMHLDPDRSWITNPDPDHPKGTQPKIQRSTYKMFLVTVNQMYGDSSQDPTTVERVVIKLLSTVHTTKHSSAVVGSCMIGAAEHLIDGCEKRIVG